MADRAKQILSVLALAVIAGCGGGEGGPDATACAFDVSFPVGDDGHAAPLAAGPGQARAGRLDAADLPPSPGGLARWRAGDFVLANDRVAVVIEDVGPSDLYDPWGGRPVGIARVEDGALVEPADFGELLVLTGRASVVTETVSVIADGSDGGPAVIRAVGRPRPTPFFDSVVGALFREEWDDVVAGIEYTLAPDSDHVDIAIVYHSPRTEPTRVNVVMHGFLYEPRMPTFSRGIGFGADGERVPYLAFVDDDATSYAYTVPGQVLSPGISASGFVSAFSDAFDLAACGETRHEHARLVIAGPGVDPLIAAIARVDGEPVRAVTGVVRDAQGAPAPGVRVHATGADGAYLTRARTGADGAYRLHVPADADVLLTAFRVGDEVVGPVEIGTASAFDLALAPAGTVHVVATDADGGALPVRVQVLPLDGHVPTVPDNHGEPAQVGGRLHVAYATAGEVTLRVPAGTWEVVVSRGYEYELHRETVTVTEGAAVEVTAALARVVDTTGVQCADFHIHTHRSSDSPDDARVKVASAVADGLEIPVRSEHEYVEDFQPLIAELGLSAHAFGMASLELTTFELFGHFGVFPLEPDPTAINGGAIPWQRYPVAGDQFAPVENLTPPELFSAVRARPEAPALVINHPRGGSNYFDYVGFDAATGLVRDAELWDEDFTLVEFFNDSGWLENLDTGVADWLALLDAGRRVFALGSSDSHGIARSPVGYPRTCLALGTDDPGQLAPDMVRDAALAGAMTISGGIYVDAWVETPGGIVGPGGDATGVGATTQVRVRVQAAGWIDVDYLDVVVDGAIVETLAIAPTDADPDTPVVRLDRTIDVPVASGAGGSYVIVAAYGDAPLEPVHPGRRPFGVTNPIFLAR